MLIKDKLKKLEESEIFKNWKDKNKCFLAHLFISSDNLDEFHYGFYDKKTDKITSFIVNSEIKQSDAEEIFKRPEAVIEELKIDEIKIDIGQALEIAKDILHKKYKNDAIVKYFVILQVLDKQLYNMSHITNTMNLINLKIDAEDGKLLKETVESLMQFRK